MHKLIRHFGVTCSTPGKSLVSNTEARNLSIKLGELQTSKVGQLGPSMQENMGAKGLTLNYSSPHNTVQSKVGIKKEKEGIQKGSNKKALVAFLFLFPFCFFLENQFFEHLYIEAENHRND